MKHKVYKPITLAISVAIMATSSFAQTKVEPARPQAPATTPALPAAVKPTVPAKPAKAPAAPCIKFNNEELQAKLKNIDLKVAEKMKLVEQKLNKMDFKKMDLAMADFDKKFAEQFKGFDKQFEGLDKQLGGLEKLNDLNNQPDYQGIEKTKVITKSYNVDANDKLAINNQYGNVVISTWAKNEIKVDVQIKAYEGSESAAQELLDNVVITDSKQPNLISFKTDIKRDSQNWFTVRRGGKDERHGVQVNYIVSMPSKNPLDVTNKFGSLNIADFNGPLNINSVNGSFKAGKLSNPSNRIIITQGSADIDTYTSGEINVSQGSLKISNADKVNAKVSMGTTKIGNLSNGGMLDIDMGSCKIESLSKNVRDMTINADKSSVSLGIDPGANFNFNVTVNLGGFSYDKSKVNLTSKDPEDSKSFSYTKTYTGQYGKGSDSKITIKSNMGSVKFL